MLCFPMLISSLPGANPLLFEHKIGIFVRFEASEPSISAVSSTKTGFLCAFRLRDPRFLAFHSYWRNIFGSWSNLTPHLWWLMY